MKKIIWITGASTGIGHALALEMAARGYTVCATARSADKLAALSVHSDIHAYAGDVRNFDDMKTIVSAIEAAHGPIEIAVLNAAIYQLTNAIPFEREKYIAQIETNQIGVINGLAALLPRMEEHKRGAVWVVGSVAGFGGLPTAAAYASTKAALINMVQSLKFDLDKRGIHIGIINPGFVDTPLVSGNRFKMPFIMPPEKAAKIIADGMAKRKFEITFPRRFSWMIKFGSNLPYALYFPIIKMVSKWSGRE
ncbi:MAG: SDR family NAD(P)-dependent oxidoreductase [Pseudomonadota bacterium]